jgi:hypothetical protein
MDVLILFSFVQPIGLNENAVRQHDAMQIISSVGPGRGTFIGGKTKFAVQRSNYGQRLPFMSTSSISDARSFKETSGLLTLS